jgi:environmental stress-induced protein Ves
MKVLLSPEILAYLDSTQGKVFLSTKDGRKFLRKDISMQWLVTQMGRNWIESPKGYDWLFAEDNGIINFLHEGLSLLTCSNLQNWLREHKDGKHWLHTGHGVLWLQSEDGQKYLESNDGIRWLKVPKELSALISS